MGSASPCTPLKKAPQAFLTRDAHKLLEKLRVIYGLRTKTKILETLIMNQAIVVAQTDRKQMKREQKAALDYCKQFAAEYEKRQGIVNYDGSRTHPTAGG